MVGSGSSAVFLKVAKIRNFFSYFRRIKNICFMRRILLFLFIFVLVITSFAFSQDRSYYSVRFSNQDEFYLQVLYLRNDNTYIYYSLFRNKDGDWRQIDSSGGVWSAIGRHKIELKTHQYIEADNEAKKLLRVLSGPDYMTFSYLTLTIHNHTIINKEYSAKPMVCWRKLSLNKQYKCDIETYLINALGFPSSFY